MNVTQLFELYYENNTEIDLNDYVGIHLTRENIKDYMATSETKTLTPEQAKEWGLTFHFIPVMYKAGDNQTSDSHFLKVVGSDDTVGKFRAQNVKRTWLQVLQLKHLLVVSHWYKFS